mgnify:CR=1 FL=1
MWKLYLQSAKAGNPADFTRAYEVAREEDSREEVRRSEAEYWESRGEFEKAAGVVFSAAGASKLCYSFGTFGFVLYNTEMTVVSLTSVEVESFPVAGLRCV